MRKKVFEQSYICYKIDKCTMLELSYDIDEYPIVEIFITKISNNPKSYKLPAVISDIQKTLGFRRFVIWTDTLNNRLEILREEL